MISPIAETAENMKKGVYNFTDNGKCCNCGKCCTNIIPISAKEIKEIKRYIKKHHIKEQKMIFPIAGPLVDFSCPFRSESEKKCLIYPVRPLICKDFKCDKPSKNIQASKDLYHRKWKVIEMRETFFNEED